MAVRKVVFPTHLRRSFAQAARKAFPNETYAICLGRKTKTSIILEALYYPLNTTLGADGLSISIPSTAFTLAEQIGTKSKMAICGCVHSHPWPSEFPVYDATPSEQDWDGPRAHPSADIHGICAVTEYGNKLHTRFRFWPIIAPIRLLT